MQEATAVNLKFGGFFSRELLIYSLRSRTGEFMLLILPEPKPRNMNKSTIT